MELGNPYCPLKEVWTSREEQMDKTGEDAAKSQSLPVMGRIGVFTLT